MSSRSMANTCSVANMDPLHANIPLGTGSVTGWWSWYCHCSRILIPEMDSIHYLQFMSLLDSNLSLFDIVHFYCCLVIQNVQLKCELMPISERNLFHPLIARFMGPTWGPTGDDRIQVGPMLAPWTLLSGPLHSNFIICNTIIWWTIPTYWNCYSKQF